MGLAKHLLFAVTFCGLLLLSLSIDSVNRKKPIFAAYESYIDELSDETGFMTGLEALILHEADEVFSVPSSPTTASLLDTYGIDDLPPTERKYNTFIPPPPPLIEVITDFCMQYYLLFIGFTSLAASVLLALSYLLLYYIYTRTCYSPPTFLSTRSHDLELLISSLEHSSIKTHLFFHPSPLCRYMQHINTVWDVCLSSTSITDLFNYCDRLKSMHRSICAEVDIDSSDLDMAIFCKDNFRLVKTIDEQLVHVRWAYGIHYTIAERLAECAAREHTTIEQLHAITAKVEQMNDLHIPVDGAPPQIYRKCDMYLKKIGTMLFHSDAYTACRDKIAAHYSQRISDRTAALQSPHSMILQNRDAASLRVSYPVRYDMRQEVAAAVSQIPRVDVAGVVAEEERQAARDARRSADEVLRQWRNEHIDHNNDTMASNTDDKDLNALQMKRKTLKSRQMGRLNAYFALIGFLSICVMYVHSSCYGRQALNPFSDPGQWLLLQLSYFCTYVNTSCDAVWPVPQSMMNMTSASLKPMFLSRLLWDAFSYLCNILSLNAGAMYVIFLPCMYNVFRLLIVQYLLRYLTRLIGLQNWVTDLIFLGCSLWLLRCPLFAYLIDSFPSTTPILLLVVLYCSFLRLDSTFLAWRVYIPSSVKAESFSLKYMKYFSGVNIRILVLGVVLPLLVIGWSCIITYYYPLQCM